MRNATIIIVLSLFAWGCSKTVSVIESNSREVSLFPSTRLSTKGYVTLTNLEDTPFDSLHNGAVKKTRSIILSAYMYPQIGGSEDYFTGAKFTKSSDTEWKHDPGYYWPISSTMDFLAYSTGIPFEENSVVWNKEANATSVDITVTNKYTQDDILFSSVYGRSSATGKESVPMIFNHAQAWIQVKLYVADASMDSVLTVRGIGLEDIYTTGHLNIENNHGNANATWSFRFDRRKDTVMDDNTGVYGKQLTTTPMFLDMLLPEQKKKAIVLYYTLGDEDLVLQERFEPSISYWLQGYRYVYEIRITLHGIECVPSVYDWENDLTEIDFN